MYVDTRTVPSQKNCYCKAYQEILSGSMAEDCWYITVGQITIFLDINRPKHKMVQNAVKAENL